VLCLLPLLYSYLASPPDHAPASSKPRAARMMASLKRRLSPGSTSSGYLPVDQDEPSDRPVAARVDGELDGVDVSRHFGWRKWALFWVPAICDMSGTTVGPAYPRVTTACPLRARPSLTIVSPLCRHHSL
jgi:hypothetical protein